MKFEIKVTEFAKEIVENMGLEELINQVVCAHSMPGDYDSLGYYGAMFFHPAEKKELEEKIKIVKDKSKIPPFIVGDIENGPGTVIKGSTIFPYMLACSSADDENLAYEMGKAAALESVELGFNWTLSPCVDIIGKIESPMVSIRSAGRSAEQVIKITKAYMKGLQDNGLMATLKHFPGEGFDIFDQHLTISQNSLKKEEWDEKSGKVFKDLIDAGVMAVMPGHIAFPDYDEKDEFFNLYPPATLSKKILNKLLKEELGFKGLIISDAINMSGMSGYMNYYKAAAAFLEYGGDMILFPRLNQAFYDEFKRLIDSGFLKIETLKNRAEKIVSLKNMLGFFNDELKDNINFNKNKHEEISRKIVDNSVSIVRDRANIIPFKINKNTRILHLILTNNYSNEEELYVSFTKVMQKYSDNVTELINPGHGNSFFDRIYNKEFDLIICSIGNKPAFGTNVIRLHGNVSRSMMQGWMRLGTPVIYVAHFHPFVHFEYDVLMDTVINTYGSIEYTLERVMKGITGEQPLKKEFIK